MNITEIAEAYGAEQADLNKVAAARLATLFPALDLKDLERSAPGWMFGVEAVTLAHHASSQSLAADVYSDVRREAGVKSRVGFISSDLNGGKLRASLTYEGVYAGKHLLSIGQQIPDVARILLANTSGIALKHGQAGGRDLIADTGKNDQASTGFGYIRMTGASPCGFCAMKALGTYRSEATAGQDYHDHDRCYALPRVRDALPEGYPDRMAQFQQVYDESVVLRRGPTGGFLVDVKPTIRNMNRAMRAA
ncbi:hypothetical protein [Agromyces aureus]|uniref:Capsid maturation protease n=1 Tax=Agromyces aureus TaxID=453304 RepID=A0A191WF10_9MICO|nr:hypothetical protein [Agromyces aureus]ANJ26812.1 hypothetical protein ATC03_08870 [Agromyces aureus]